MSDFDLDKESERSAEFAMGKMVARYILGSIFVFCVTIVLTCDGPPDLNNWQVRARACEDTLKVLTE